MAQTPAQGLTRIGDDVWAFLRPRGGWREANTGLVVAPGSASLVVDTMWDVAWARRVAQVQQPLVSRAPITEAVNTHSDGDHWWGNDTLPATARITTSAAARQGMREDLPPAALTVLATAGQLLGRVPGPIGRTGAYMARIPGDARFPRRLPRMPDHTFDTTERLVVGGRPVDLERLGPAHTAGDVIVHVPDAGVVFSGDLLFVGSTPVLWHGPLENWTDALDRLLALDADVYVPGHGPMCGSAEIREVRDYWMWLDAAARPHHARGTRPLDAARALVRSAEFVRFRDWHAPERIVLSLSTLYHVWDGNPPGPPTVVRRARAFADAEALLREGTV
ncbi:MBL fold metallo-hydrolase [Rhodococcus chondri]|uniref:MBL fold metallo-hydrolase n=1 Tax=Rhodococcus chondri TaxID=3065941 RepID=A0ABU7JMM2_9NOCA|nr:MBL fold metallo-hydrolase [Rhodococcus sp. CC-R104]MEE2030567.1 MBL fold metallo-hydrolase [Rhodococcus sp. CC-R104]